MWHKAIVRILCADCGAVTEREYVARVIETALKVKESTRCARCGHAEQVERGNLPDEARDAFCATEGRWTLTVDELGPRSGEALRTIALLLRMHASDARKLVNDHEPVIAGALVEAELAQQRLVLAGAKVSLSRA